jgi:fatty-acyl-CoA synthase
VLRADSAGEDQLHVRPPTVWISFLRHEAFEERDLASLEKVQYGASIMPVPVLRELRERLPNPRFYNCYGQSEISPLATVLRPEELNEDRLASVGRPALLVETDENRGAER